MLLTLWKNWNRKSRSSKNEAFWEIRWAAVRLLAPRTCIFPIDPLCTLRIQGHSKQKQKQCVLDEEFENNKNFTERQKMRNSIIKEPKIDLTKWWSDFRKHFLSHSFFRSLRYDEPEKRKVINQRISSYFAACLKIHVIEV